MVGWLGRLRGKYVVWNERFGEMIGITKEKQEQSRAELRHSWDELKDSGREFVDVSRPQKSEVTKDALSDNKSRFMEDGSLKANASNAGWRAYRSSLSKKDRRRIKNEQLSKPAPAYWLGGSRAKTPNAHLDWSERFDYDSFGDIIVEEWDRAGQPTAKSGKFAAFHYCSKRDISYHEITDWVRSGPYIEGLVSGSKELTFRCDRIIEWVDSE